MVIPPIQSLLGVVMPTCVPLLPSGLKPSGSIPYGLHATFGSLHPIHSWVLLARLQNYGRRRGSALLRRFLLCHPTALDERQALCLWVEDLLLLLWLPERLLLCRSGLPLLRD